MKLLYFGTVCNLENYEKTISNFKIKPSIATNVFENALLEGFKAHDVDIDIYSFPMISAFPGSNMLYWKDKHEQLQCGYKNTWIKTVNLVGFKQLTQSFSSKRIIKEWIRINKNVDDTAVLIYSVYYPIAKNIIKLTKKHNIPCFAIVADLPRDMYANKKISWIKKMFSNMFVKNTLKIQGRFDGYIYLTEAMAEVINPDKPFEIVEGIANVNNEVVAVCNVVPKCKAIMYAGALNVKYGIANLLESFKKIDFDIELWIFGSGDYESEIKKAAEFDKRIKFYGRVDRGTILEYERKATLLVNVRNCTDDFTKYSFPSKTIEYMVSGTPLLTTKLPGIPNEYFDYVFTIDNNEPDTIKNRIIEIFNYTDRQLKDFGNEAKEFVLKNKNSYVQAKKTIDVIKTKF